MWIEIKNRDHQTLVKTEDIKRVVIVEKELTIRFLMNDSSIILQPHDNHEAFKLSAWGLYKLLNLGDYKE